MAVVSIAAPPDARRDRLRAEARAAHDAYMAHVRGCQSCVGHLCPTGSALDRLADSAGARLDQAA